MKKDENAAGRREDKLANENEKRHENFLSSSVCQNKLVFLLLFNASCGTINMKSKKEMRAEALAKAKAWHDARSRTTTTTVSTPQSSTTSKSKVLKTSPAPAFYAGKSTTKNLVASSPEVNKLDFVEQPSPKASKFNHDAPPLVAEHQVKKGSLVDQAAFLILSCASTVVGLAATLLVWSVSKVVSIVFWGVELAATAAIEEFNRDPK